MSQIKVNSISNPDSTAPSITFLTAPGVMNGNEDFAINVNITDDISGIKSARLFYTPDHTSLAFKDVGAIPAGNNTINFCVPNKNHPNPAFKVIAVDNNDNSAEEITGVTGPAFSISLDTDPTVPTFTSSLGILTKDQPTTLNLSGCETNTCALDALYYETPTVQKYVIANTTGITPLVTDPNWELCTDVYPSGYLMNNFPSENTHTYYVWTKTEDLDLDNVTPINYISSTNNTLNITYDNTAPIDTTGTGFTFDNAVELVGDNIPVRWNLFTDQQVVDHRVELYTDNTCNILNLAYSFNTSSATITDNTNLDGIGDGEYWGKVVAIDHVGLEGSSGCSTDSVFIDSNPPVDNTANVQFTDTIDTDGDDIAITWTAFTDITLTDHRIYIYDNSSCTGPEVLSVLTGSNTNSDSTSVDGLATNDYWARVEAIDGTGASTISACSTDTVRVDKDSPIDNGANLQFADATDADGNDINVSWVAFTDPDGLAYHKLYTYTNSSCSTGTTDHGTTGSGTNSNNTIIDGLADGEYWGTVEAFDPGANATMSACSTDSIIVDTTAPVDNTANLQFIATHENTGNDISVTWTAFTDLTLSDHTLYTYEDAGCTVNEVNHGLTGSDTNSDAAIIDGLAEGQYWAKVRAHDQMGFDTLSACSTDSIIIDKTAPTDNVANLQFTNAYNNTGDNVAVSWTAFTDTYLSDHQLYTYTDSGCTAGEVDHGVTGSSTNSNGTIIDGLTDGVYYAKVKAIDSAGNETLSACSTDSITIDLTDPTDVGANLQFADATDIDGDDLNVSWTAFTDLNGIVDYRITTYLNSATCAAGSTAHPLIGSNATTNNTTIDSLADGTYYGTVTAVDSAGNTTTSACSTDSIIVDSTAPTDNTASLQFVATHENTGNDISVTWTAFTDLTLSDHTLYTYTDAGCTTAEIDHGLTGSATNSDAAIIDGLAEGQYWAKVRAHDQMGFDTLSACSTDSIIIDKTAPTDNTAALVFTNDYNNTGDNVAVVWTAFTDTYLSDHQLYTYTDSGCTAGEVDHGLIGSSVNNNNTVIDGLTDGVYYAKVKAIDLAGNETLSACSTDFITIDLTDPTDNVANLQFTDIYDNDGNDLNITWTAFTDLNSIADHQILTYTDSGCTTDEVIHPLTGSGTNSDSASVDSLTDNTYYAKVRAFDSAGNSTTSACSTDSIIVDTVAPAIGSRIVVGTVVTGQPFGLFNLSDCSDLDGVKITIGAGSPPLAGDAGWQTCDEVNYSMTHSGLAVGANNLQFWIKDAAQNVQTAFIAHQVFYNPPQLTVENGPTINTNIADISIDYCAEAGITHVLFKDADVQPAVGDVSWQACTTVTGALKSYILTPGDHTMKVFFKYQDNSVSLNAVDLPVRFEPLIAWEETPEVNRPHVTFTLDSCSGINEVLFNQTTQPAAGAPEWQTCTTAQGGLTHTLTADGSQTLNVWYKDGTNAVLTEFTQVAVNFVPPTASIQGGANINTNAPMLSIADCTNISKVFVKLDDALVIAPSAGDFTATGQNCTTALNAITTPIIPSEGVHTLDVWFQFSDSYILDPWHTRIIVSYTQDDTTAPPVTGGEGAATPLAMTLTNGDASTPPILLAAASRAEFTLNTCQPNPAVAMSGTVSVTAADTTVTGVGTSFTTEISAGDYINISGEVLKVDSVTNNTTLELVFAHVAGATSVATTKEYPQDLITDMIITESATAPSSTDPDWNPCSTGASEFKSKSLTPDGVHNLYAWFKDASGNVSVTPLTQDVNVQSSPDVTPPPRPLITVEGAPEIATTPAEMTVSSCTDVDQVYLEPSVYPAPYVAPSAAASGWQDCSEVIGAIKYDVNLIGSYTISAWFKDAAGNINPTPRDVSFIFNPSESVLPTPIAYWTFDDVHRKDSRYVDAKGNSHLAIWDKTNVPSTTGWSNQAIDPTGTNSYLVTENTDTLKPTIAVTMSMWAYLTNGESATKAIAGNIQAGTGGYGFKLESSELRFYASGQSTAVATSTYTTGWHHITGTSDGRYINIYIDGKLESTTDMGAPANLTYGCNPIFTVASDNNCTINPLAANSFDEKLDEIVIWDKYLTDEQVSSHYIDAYNLFKVGGHSTAPTTIQSAAFFKEELQNVYLTVDNCENNKFIYVDETTHPPTVDTDRWQLCTTVQGGIVHKDLTQGPHELKIWGKDEYNNITAGYLKVDTTVESMNFHPSGLHYYSFDNIHMSSDIVYDIYTGFHATNNGADTGVQGIQNESFNFVRANSDYVERKYASNSQVTSGVTLSIWADLTQNDNVQQTIAGNRMAGHGYAIEIDNANSELRFYVETAAGTRHAAISTATYTSGLHNIIGTYDGRYVKLYYDGNEVDNQDYTTSSDIQYSCLGSFTIGAGATCNNGPVAGTHFNNNIDEVQVWGDVMTSTNIYELFNGQDTVPPLAVPVTPKNNDYTITVPVAKLNVSDCSDISKVYVSLGTDKPGSEIDNWQTCSTTGDLIESSLLALGNNDLKVWFMDAAGNVSDTSTDLSITYNFDATIPNPDSYYTLDRVNIDGAKVYDVVSGKDGNNYSATESTGTSYEALEFDGTSQYVEVPFDASFQPSTTVTLSAWFKVSSFDANRHVIAGNYNAGGFELALGNNTLEFVAHAIGSQQVASISTGGLATDTWHHVAGVWDNGTIRLFVNRVEEVNTVVAGVGSLNYTNNNSFIIGAAPDTVSGPSGNYFEGEIDEVAFFDAALTDTVIEAIYDRGSVGDKLYYDITPPAIPVNLNIIYYNSLVSRANLTVTDCTGLDYIIVTKDAFPPDKNDENWQLCNTLTGGLLSKELSPDDVYAKFWTKDLFGNISTEFEYVPIITNYDKPIARPVVHWTMDATHYDNTNHLVVDRIGQVNLKNESYEFVLNDPGNDSCTGSFHYRPLQQSISPGGNGVLNEGILFGDKTILRSNSPENAKLLSTEKVSVAAWVYLTGSGTHTNEHIISNEYNGKGWALRVDATSPDSRGLRFTVHTAAGTLEPYLETKNYTTGWHLVIGTYDGQEAALYFDGIFVKSFANGAPSPIVYEPGVNTFVGAKASTGDEPTDAKPYTRSGGMSCTTNDLTPTTFNGEIDEIIVWDKVLTKLEASSLYHNGADILYPTDNTEPALPNLSLENTRPELFADKA